MYIKQDYDDGFEHLMLDLKEKYPKAIFELSGISVEDLDHTKFAKKYFSKKNVADASVDANANVQIKNIATFMVERHKGSDKLDSLFLFWKTAKKLFSEREANILIEKEINKDLNVQDCGNFFLPYCIAFDTYDLLLKGLPFVTNYPSAPAKHSDVFWQHTVQLLQSAAPQMMGATAIPNFIVIYSALLKYDSLNEEYPIPNYNTHKKLFERYVTQRFQELVFTLNQPLRQVQSTFSNITIFDSFFMKELCSKYIVNDTLIDSDFAMYIQKLFLLTVKELNKKQIGTFPILTAQFKKDENGEVEDTEFLDLIAEVNLDSAHLNIYSDVSLTSLSSCCFDGEQKILVKSSTKGVFLTSFEDFKNLPYTGNKENLKIAHNGNWVTGKFLEIPRSNKLMYKITTVNNKELLVTSDHKHLTTEGDKITSNLTESDYLVFSNRPFSAIPENNQNLTYEQGVLIGAYLGDGSRRKLKDVNSASVYFSLNKDKYEKLLTLFKKALNDFGVDSHICLATPYNNVYPVQITSLKLFDILNYWVSGNYCYTKEINLNCLTQNEEFRKGIIDGIYLTDGGNSNRIYTTSKNLVNQ
ncbi:MAG TPA: anaerobic ribonucleoside-triphosphate reductase, partial [Candidatus Pacearchaeota archaeon]|nr:anaerobic ribonucleoside-triphosphate reductase [Candidatus Pacearchaeota archaeon]